MTTMMESGSSNEFNDIKEQKLIIIHYLINHLSEILLDNINTIETIDKFKFNSFLSSLFSRCQLNLLIFEKLILIVDSLVNNDEVLNEITLKINDNKFGLKYLIIGVLLYLERDGSGDQVVHGATNWTKITGLSNEQLNMIKFKTNYFLNKLNSNLTPLINDEFEIRKMNLHLKAIIYNNFTIRNI